MHGCQHHVKNWNHNPWWLCRLLSSSCTGWCRPHPKHCGSVQCCDVRGGIQRIVCIMMPTQLLVSSSAKSWQYCVMWTAITVCATAQHKRCINIIQGLRGEPSGDWHEGIAGGGNVEVGDSCRWHRRGLDSKSMPQKSMSRPNALALARWGCIKSSGVHRICFPHLPLFGLSDPASCALKPACAGAQWRFAASKRLLALMYPCRLIRAVALVSKRVPANRAFGMWCSASHRGRVGSCCSGGAVSTCHTHMGG